MGNEQTKVNPKQYQQQMRTLDKVKLDVACLKVKGYLELNRDRRINQALNKEKALSQCVRSAQRVRVDEYQRLSSLVTDVNYIEACNLVLRCADVIKDQSIRICQSYGDPEKIPDLMPFLETILWSASQLNLQAVQEFRDLIVIFFGAIIYDPNALKQVDPELKNLFKSPIADVNEVNSYAMRFAEKYGIPLEQLNAPGHQFSLQVFQPLPQMGQQNQFNQNQYGQNPDQPPQYNQFGQLIPQPQQGGFPGNNQNYGGPQNPQQPYGGGSYGVPQNQQQNGNYGPPQNMPSAGFGGTGYQPTGNNQGPPPNQPYGGYGGPVNPTGNYQGPSSNNQPQGGYGVPGNQSNNGTQGPPPNNQSQGFGQPQGFGGPTQPQHFEGSTPGNDDYKPQLYNNGGGNPYGQLKLTPNLNLIDNQKIVQQPQIPSNQQHDPNQQQSFQSGNQNFQSKQGGNNLGNPMANNDLDDLEARFNRLKDNL